MRHAGRQDEAGHARHAGACPLAEAAKAHEIGDGGHVAGKLVLTMR